MGAFERPTRTKLAIHVFVGSSPATTVIIPAEERAMPKPSPPSRLPRTVFLLGATSLFADVASEMIFPLLPLFVASLGAGPAFLGLVEGVADATASMLKLGSGYWADKTSHRKRLVLFGYGLAAVVKPFMAVAAAPWHVMAIRVTDRVGKGIRSAPRDVLISAAALPGQAGRAFGFHRAMDHAGAVLGPIIATVALASGMPLRNVFLLAVVPGLLSLACVALVREDRRPPAPATSASPKDSKLSPRLKGYLAVLAVFALGNSSDAFLLLRAQELGVAVPTIPILWMVLHVSKLIASYLAGDLSDRLPRAWLIVAGWAVYAATYLGLGFANQAWHVWVLFVVYGGYYGLTEPVEKAIIKDLSNSSNQGRAFGAYNFIIGASAIPASVLMGWLWQAYGPRAALATGAIIGLLSALLLLGWTRTTAPPNTGTVTA